MKYIFKNRAEYDAAKVRINNLIDEATARGMLEPDMDNDYTREIGVISEQMADYEDAVLNLSTLKLKSSLEHPAKISYHLTMPVLLHESVARKASQLGQSISEYVNTIMARELKATL